MKELDIYNYKLQCYDDVKEIEQITDEWKKFTIESFGNWIYSLPEWCISWYRTLGQEGKLKIIIVRDKEGTVVGLAPMWEGTASWSELRIKKCEFISGIQADYHDLIIQKGKEETIVPILMDGIIYFLGKTDVIELRQIPQESPNLPFIRNYFKAKKYRCFEQQSISPYCNLEGNFPFMEKGWSSSHRGDIRRQKKRLSELGKLSLKVYTSSEEILNDIEDFFKMHTDRWHSAGYPAMFLNPKYREFYKEIIKSIGVKGGVHFSKLSVDGIAISYHFGFVYKNRFYWYKPAFKAEYENYSPSKVHISMLMEEGFKQGWKVFDFLIGNESYKYQWGVKELPCITIVSRRSGLVGWIGYEWLRWGRYFVKRSLKGKTLEKIRSLYIERPNIFKKD